ncbi:UDP-4-amino-4, 6-dideoxy-N-acetyl-beta-L-altrosamine transaminase [archaeon BMS3Abin16]|nr:UDP-4-amino-4, 6-dideoxy-N-acetyl-beta-L-altrosamine transaminase [archaeon BMS3Abin16]
MSERFIPYGRQTIDEDDIAAVVEVLKSDWLTTGPKIKEFEDAVCRYISCKQGIAVNSGTSALDVAVASLELPKGSEIITTPFTFVATSNAILYNNLLPVFADIKPDTFNINPDEIRKKITDKTRAIIYVDFAGQPCDIDAIRGIADEHDLYLIEDACHALGAEYKGKKVGSFANITVFSFHPVKPITTGEGGMAVTNNKCLANRMRMLRNHGIDLDPAKRKDYRYDMKTLGRNYRMTDFQAALGISQLRKLDRFIIRRTELVKGYNNAFESLSGITCPVFKPDRMSSNHLYTVLLNPSISRDEFFTKMRGLNIGVNVHYIPVYHHSYYRNAFDVSPADYPVTEDVFNRILTLPLHQGMTKEDVDYVIDSVKSILKKGHR